MRNYKSRAHFWANLQLAMVASLCLILMAFSGHLLTGLVLLTLVACCLNSLRTPQGRLCAVTLSVPEILRDILDALKLETPELFGPGGFAQDFSSKTAVLGDKITAKISHVPVIAAYDPSPGVGFYSGAQDVVNLIEDVPVTLNQLKHVPVKIQWLTGLATKGVDLYKAACANIGYALGKEVVDQVLAACASGVSNSLPVSPVLTNLDTWDGPIRKQCNSQKMLDQRRWGFITSPLAEALGLDDRVRSKLFFDERCASRGFRRWVNIAGFSTLREYPDITLAGNQVAGIVGDSRLAAIAVRKIEDMTSTAKALGVPSVMEFWPLTDAESGLEICGIGWQEAGTGDVIVSAAILFGIGCGNQGGVAGTMTDNAGLKLLSL